MKTEVGEYNNWKYRITLDNHWHPIKMDVLPDFEIRPPKELYKYYSFNDYNIESICGKYFYGSHPFDLNDPFDLNKNLLRLNPNIQNEFFQLLFSHFGILSMTESGTDPLMWSHYCSHKGFVVKYSINSIPNYFFGPFPINYIERFVPIIYDNLPLKLLIACDIKYKGHWAKENEWRFLLYSPKRMKLPKYIQLQLKDRCSRKRFFYYNDNFSITEVILGYKLLLNEKVKLNCDLNNKLDLIIKDCLLIRFLKFLQGQKIKTYIVDINPNQYSELTKREVSITSIRKNRFILENIDI